MENEVMTIAEWEKNHGRLIINDQDLDLEKSVNVDEFNAICDSRRYLGVDWEYRVDWLERNGYEMTRENLANADLPPVNESE